MSRFSNPRTEKVDWTEVSIAEEGVRMMSCGDQVLKIYISRYLASFWSPDFQRLSASINCPRIVATRGAGGCDIMCHIVQTKGYGSRSLARFT